MLFRTLTFALCLLLAAPAAYSQSEPGVYILSQNERDYITHCNPTGSNLTASGFRMAEDLSYCALIVSRLSLDGDVVWTHEYADFDLDITPTTVNPRSDGSTLLATGIGPNSSSIIVDIASDGSITSNKAVDQGYFMISDAVQSPNSPTYLAGTAGSGTMAIARLSSHGEAIGLKSYSADEALQYAGASINSEGHLAVAALHGTGSNKTMVVLELNATGSLLWSFELELEAYSLDQLKHFMVLSDGSYAFVAEVSDNADRSVVIIRTSRSGTVLATRTIDLDSHMISTALVESEFGNVVLALQAGITAGSSTATLVSMQPEELAVVRSIEIATTGSLVQKAVTMSNGSDLGFTFMVDGKMHLVVVASDLSLACNGEPVALTTSTTTVSRSTVEIVTQDQPISYTDYDLEQSTRSLTFDQTCSAAPVALSTDDTDRYPEAGSDRIFRPFPNPSNGLIHIALDPKDSKPGTLRVINMMGQVVFVQPVSAYTGRVMLDLRSVAPGPYLLTLQKTEEAVQYERILVEDD